jgi:DNA-binding NtrC family response regulator
MSEKIKVLIIDDDPSTLDLFKVRLSNKFNIFLADNGEEGLNIKKSENISIVLTDILIDSQDGFQILQSLRVAEPTCIVFAMTANHEMSELVSCLSNGFNDYFAKPVNFETIEKAIEFSHEKMIRWREKEQAS